jgi:hypothetical protein
MRYNNQNIIYSNELTSVSSPEQRGVQVYNLSQIIRATGRDKNGALLSVPTAYPLFYLTIHQRNEIFKLSSPILGLISSRMNRISSLDFNVTTQKYNEDKIVYQIKAYKELYDEYKNDVDFKSIILKAKIVNNIKEYLVDIKPDLSNFDRALLRWKKRIDMLNTEKTGEIYDWLMEPNQETSWIDYMKKVVYNLMIHGCEGTYLQMQDNVLENFDSLPGGTIFRIKNPYFSGVAGYIQVVEYYDPQIFWGDEILYMSYLPSSVQNTPFIPLEALINKVTESLYFDKLMADQADGTKPPEKMVIITNTAHPFGDVNSESLDVSLDKDEQVRIEEKINEPRKNAVMTFSGNNAQIVDLSRENTMPIQMQRQKDIREEVALVFNASNIEVNLTGSQNTSGRETSESQIELTQGRGIAPIAKLIMEGVNKKLIPYRYGTGYCFEFDIALNEKEELELDLLKLRTGDLTQNELRESKNKPLFEGEQYDLPRDSSLIQEQPGTEFNPLVTRNKDE